MFTFLSDRFSRRYEDLVTNPRKILSALLSYIGEPYYVAMPKGFFLATIANRPPFSYILSSLAQADDHCVVRHQDRLLAGHRPALSSEEQSPHHLPVSQPPESALV